jgi:uncharacterized protein (DUF433 family)
LISLRKRFKVKKYLPQEIAMNVQPTPSEVLHPYIERRPGVQGGRAVIKGSRFPVSSIVQDYRRGLSVEEILRDFPALRPAEVHDALSYYYDHRAEIDQEIVELTDLDAVMRKYPPTLLPPRDDSH